MGVTDWVGMGANVFSSVGTVGAFAVGMVLLRQEHQREEVRNDEQRRDQAVKVSAWIEAARTASSARELHFHVHNASQMPIYEVALLSPVPEDDGSRGEAEFIGLVPPGQTVRRPAPQEWLAGYFSPEPIEIEFLDSGGLRWTRDEDGVLTRDDTRTTPATSPSA
jgi:hypothetical protein